MAESEITIAKRLNSYFDEAEIAHWKWRGEAVKCAGFYMGGDRQWDSGDIAKLEAEGRPHLTINHIKSIVNTVAGLQRQNKSDVVVFPKRGGQGKIAKVLSALVKHADDECDGEYEESDMFVDGLVYGKGWELVDIDYSLEPVTGQLIKYRISPYSVLEDPNCRDYNLNHPHKGARFISREYWWDKDSLILQFPDKEDDLFASGEKLSKKDYRMVEKEKYGFPQSETDEPEPLGETVRERQYRVREFYWKSYESIVIAVNLEEGSERRLESKEEVKFVRQQMKENKLPYRLIERVEEGLNKTTLIGDVVLENIEDPYNGISDFPLFRFCPYFLDGHPMGVVEDLKDPQRELNKRRSQVLHHLNSSANSGWMIQDGSMSPEEKRNLEDFGSKPGGVFSYSRMMQKPEKIEPTRMSEGHMAMAQIGADDLRKVSGVNPDLMGEQSRKVESGIAMAMRHRAGILSTETIFDNYRRTKALASQYMIDRIRGTDVYSSTEIMSIIEEEDFDVNEEELRDWKKGRYGVKVSWGDKSPTTRMANFQVIMEAYQRAPDVIPIELLLEMSDIPNKEKILAQIQQNREAMARQAEAEAMAKTGQGPTAGPRQAGAGQPPAGAGMQIPGRPGPTPGSLE